MNEDLKELLRLLNAHEVEYLLIGGHAVAHHGYARYTEDVDLWLHRTLENAVKLDAALQAFGLPTTPNWQTAFLQDRTLIRLGNAPNRLDLLNFAGTIPFNTAKARCEATNLNGVQVSVVSYEDLIDAKRSAGRPRDLLDIQELEKRCT